MRAGLLDRRITIQSRTNTVSATGSTQPGYTTLATVWAAVKKRTGRQSFEGGPTPTAEIIFRIRHRTDLTRDMRVSFDDEKWDIISINEIDRRVGLELICKATQVT